MEEVDKLIFESYKRPQGKSGDLKWLGEAGLLFLLKKSGQPETDPILEARRALGLDGENIPKMSERTSTDEFAGRLGRGELPATTQARFVVKEMGVSVNSTEPLLIIDFPGPGATNERSDLRDLFEVEITDPGQ